MLDYFQGVWWKTVIIRALNIYTNVKLSHSFIDPFINIFIQSITNAWRLNPLSGQMSLYIWCMQFFWINNYTSMLVLHNSVFEYFLMSWIQLFKIQNTKRGGRGPQQVPRLPYARTFTSSNPLIFQLPSIQGGSLYLLYAKEASFQLNVVTGSFLSPHSVEVSLDTSCQECFRAEMFSI